MLRVRTMLPRRTATAIFFFNDTATTEIYTLSLHDALPISCWRSPRYGSFRGDRREMTHTDRKSTRLNSSHLVISYAVFCLKKKSKCAMRRRMVGQRGSGLLRSVEVCGG